MQERRKRERPTYSVPTTRQKELPEDQHGWHVNHIPSGKSKRSCALCGQLDAVRSAHEMIGTSPLQGWDGMGKGGSGESNSRGTLESQ